MSDDKKQNAPIKDETLDKVSGGVSINPISPPPSSVQPPLPGPPRLTHPVLGKK